MLFYSMIIAMDSSELLRLQLSKQIDCARNGVAVGATGPRGPVGPTGPAGSSSIPKMFTLYIDFDGPNSISRIYIPPQLSTSPSLAAGGEFTSDIAGELVFAGTTNIFIANITHAFPIGLSATGYTTSLYWVPTATSYLGGGNLRWQNAEDNVLNLSGVTATRLNGANTAVRPTSGVTQGWLATLTIFYL